MRRYLKNIFILISFSMMYVSCIHAADNNDISKEFEDFSYEVVSKQEPTTQQHVSANTLKLTLINNNRNYVLITAGLFAFTLIIITFLMRTTPHGAKDIVTIIGLVSVIFGSILLVLVVDTTETLTAPMGILGAIAGYLFGTAQKKETQKSSD